VSTRRLLKAAEAIREVVAASILTELRDPRVRDVTVVGVKVSPDLREAKVSVSVMGDEKQQQLSLRGLQNAAGFLQSRIAGRIDCRYTPRLQFVLDKGIQNSLRVGEILEQIRREKQPTASGVDAAPEADSESADAPGGPEPSGPEPSGPEPSGPAPTVEIDAPLESQSQSGTAGRDPAAGSGP
jgi:ribosome-binding factor A